MSADFAAAEELPPAARRVQDAAHAAGLPARVKIMAASTRTAAEAAQACGCDVAQIVKSLVFRGVASKQAYLLLVSGANRVDEKAAAAVIGEAIERPDAAFVREATGFAIGGVAPFGSTQPLPVFYDPTLLGFAQVWAAAGTPLALFEAEPGALVAATKARPLS